MIQLTPHMRIMVALEPADFRKGIDGLARLCRAELSGDPFGGTLFLFRNRRRTAIKGLVYDGQGFWLLHKRLSSGRFRHWPSGASEPAKRLQAHEVHLLLSGGDPSAAATAAEPWRPLKTVG
ncbi:MAG: IS66 family insertion sequence element accessory protein TnpB [Planctomycetota bacterium]